jgi:hypothetical protein
MEGVFIAVLSAICFVAGVLLGSDIGDISVFGPACTEAGGKMIEIDDVNRCWNSELNKVVVVTVTR